MPWIRSRILLGLVVAVGGVAPLLACAAHSSRPVNQTYGLQADTNDGPAVPVDASIRNAVEHALRTHQTKSVPPVAGLQAQPDGVTVADAAPSADDLVKQRADGDADIKSIFGPSVAAQESQALDSAIAMEQSGHFRVLGGGYEHLKFTSVESDNGRITVIFTVDTWSQFTFMNPDGSWRASRPENTLNATMTLARDPGTRQWAVQAFDWSFAPGSEP